MSLFKAKARQTTAVERATEGADVYVRAMRDGSLAFADFLQLMVFEGKAFTFTVGAFSTPITAGGAGTILDQDRPEGILSVPSGYSLLPYDIRVQLQTPLLATDSDESECLIAADISAAYDASGTVTTEVAYSLKDGGIGSVCTCRSAATANITSPTLGIELARSVIIGDVQGTAACTMWTKNELVYTPRPCPVIKGPAAIYIYGGGTVATKLFAQVCWVELPSAYLT